MCKTSGAFIIALVAGLFALGMFTVQGAARAEEPAGLHATQPAGIDLAVLADHCRWLELLAAASDAASHNVSDPVPVLFKLRAMRMLGETDAALKQADEAVARYPDNAHIILERAWIHAFSGSWPLALSDARRAQEIDPKLAEALIVQGIAYRELLDWDNTISTYTKVLHIGPDDTAALLNRGRAFVEKAMWQEARSDLDRCIALSNDNAEAYYHRGRANAGSGRLADAVGKFTRAISLKPEATSPYTARAEVMARSGNWETAARDAYTAIVLGSRKPGPYLTACQASIALGDFEALAEYAESGIRTAPELPDFHRFAGRAYRENGDLTKALGAYDQALKIVPGDAGTLLGRALTAILLRRYDKAEADCSAVLNTVTSGTAYALRGFARMKTGSLERALEDSTNALTLEPKEVMALLTRANIQLLRNRGSDALRDSRKALKIDPAQPWAYITYGSALTMAGKNEEGLKMLDQAVEMVPDDGEAYLARGRCLAALGRKSDAEKDFEKAAGIDAWFADAVKAEMERLNKGQMP